MWKAIWSFGLLLLLSGSTTAAEPPSTWRAGVAAIKITPEKPLWLSGYVGRDKPAQGTLSDLHAKALVIEDPTGRRAVAVTMDLIGMPRELGSAICAELKAKYQFPREAIFLSSSHTHSGPVVNGNLMAMYNLDEEQLRLVKEYADSLKAKLVDLVGSAIADLAPADLSRGCGLVTFAVNRRNNPKGPLQRCASLGRLKGPVDHDVPVLAVRAKDGKLRAVLFGYSCHATVLSGYQYSADYPGFAQSAIEQAHPGAVALFFAGCGGDQNPLPRRSAAMAEGYGKELARGVNDILKAPMKPINGPLGLSYAEVDRAARRAAEPGQADSRYEQRPSRDRQSSEKAACRSRPWRAAAFELSIPGSGLATRRGLSLVTLGGEVCVDYSLRLKKELGHESTWVAGYANDVMAYIPSLRVLKEGGYEGGGSMPIYGLPAVWSPKIEETIVAAVHKGFDAGAKS